MLSASCHYCLQGLLQVEEMADFLHLPVGLSPLPPLTPKVQLAWDTCPSSPPIWAPIKASPGQTPVPSHAMISLQHMTQMFLPKPSRGGHVVEAGHSDPL